MNETLPLKLEETIWVLSSHTGTQTYDFAFESYFQCRRRWNPGERVCAIGRFGAAEDYDSEYQNLKNVGIELIHSVEEHKKCSTLSGWYPLLKDITPKSIVYEHHPTIRAGFIKSCGQMRSAGLRHRGGRDKAYQEDTSVESNEEAAARRKQMSA